MRGNAESHPTAHRNRRCFRGESGGGTGKGCGLIRASCAQGHIERLLVLFRVLEAQLNIRCGAQQQQQLEPPVIRIRPKTISAPTTQRALQAERVGF